MKKNNIVYVASSVGALAGLGYAFKQNKSFWGYVGYFFLGSIVGSLAGNIIGGLGSDATSKEDNTPEEDKTKTKLEIKATPLSASKTALVMPKNIQSLRNNVAMAARTARVSNE